MPIKALRKTLLNMQLWLRNMDLHITPYLVNFYTPMLHVDLTLALRRLRCLNSPHVRTITISPCTKRSPSTFALPKTGVLSTVDPNRIPLYHRQTSPAPLLTLIYVHSPLWIPKNLPHSLTPLTPTICATANPPPATPSYCKTQSITATSSTKADFLAAVATAKHA